MLFRILQGFFFFNIKRALLLWESNELLLLPFKMERKKNASDIPDVNKKNDYNIIYGKSPHFMLLAAFVFWLLNFLFD